jgi:nucleotide-binding universal stress UspA family protein
MTDDRPILICYDGSNEAHRAIPAAASLLAPRRAVVLDIGPPLTPEESWAETFTPVSPDLLQENAEAALERATAGAAQARRAGFAAVATAEVDAPAWQGIVDYAAKLDAAVIVIGSHGRNAGGELLHGSVSHQVAAHAGRPVLIIPPPRD